MKFIISVTLFATAIQAVKIAHSPACKDGECVPCSDCSAISWLFHPAHQHSETATASPAQESASLMESESFGSEPEGMACENCGVDWGWGKHWECPHNDEDEECTCYGDLLAHSHDHDDDGDCAHCNFWDTFEYD